MKTDGAFKSQEDFYSLLSVLGFFLGGGDDLAYFLCFLPSKNSQLARKFPPRGIHGATEKLRPRKVKVKVTVKLKLPFIVVKLNQLFNCIILVMLYNRTALNSALICVLVDGESCV